MLISTILVFSCNGTENANGIVLIDGNKDYPVLDLSLSDIATIEFVPLKLGKDSLLLGSPAANTGGVRGICNKR